MKARVYFSGYIAQWPRIHAPHVDMLAPQGGWIEKFYIPAAKKALHPGANPV